MIVMCNMKTCPYYGAEGFGGICGKPIVVSIDEMGMCKVVWKNGSPADLSRFNEDKNYKKEFVTIVDNE